MRALWSGWASHLLDPLNPLRSGFHAHTDDLAQIAVLGEIVWLPVLRPPLDLVFTAVRTTKTDRSVGFACGFGDGEGIFSALPDNSLFFFKIRERANRSDRLNGVLWNASAGRVRFRSVGVVFRLIVGRRKSSM